MAKTSYSDLAEFGLVLVGPEDATFSALVRDIQDRPQPFGSWPTWDLDSAAVLLNRSGKAIITLAYIWRYTTAEGRTRADFLNLGSSTQMDVLSGQSGITRDLGSFVLAGSKRLITEQGMFGNNLDVLPPDFAVRGGGYVGSGGGGRPGNAAREKEITEIELALDAVIFEDGLCVGLDESGLIKSVTEDLQLKLSTAREIVASLKNGASVGQVFEILRPLAGRHQPLGGIGDRGRIPSLVLIMFADTAIHKLLHAADPELLPWFEMVAQSSPLPLRRP
jgi:hypothetical protein